MRHYITILLTIVFIISSCHTDSQNVIDTIANSPEYKAYMDAGAAIKLAIASGLWNPEELLDLDKTSATFSYRSPCEIKASEYQVEGIADYLRLACADIRSVEILDKEYQFRSLSSDDKTSIRIKFYSEVLPNYKEKHLDDITNAIETTNNN